MNERANELCIYENFLHFWIIMIYEGMKNLCCKQIYGIIGKMVKIKDFG